MLVCHCLRVFDRAIRECVRSGARSVDEVGSRCGAGTGCGGCREFIESIVDGEQDGETSAAECPRAAALRVAA